MERQDGLKLELGDITYELTAVLVLTAAFFAVGTWIFTRRHMPAVG